MLIAFGVTVCSGCFPGSWPSSVSTTVAFARGYEAAVPESVAAMIGAILLFVLPVNWRARRFTLSWEQAVRIDWGIILLFGGGLAMGALAFSTGLAEAMGQGITGWLPGALGVHADGALHRRIAIVMSETASNTASANMIVPVAIAVAQAAGIDPLQPALGATFGASMGFMMPVSTPPNAIVYSSGHVPITVHDAARHRPRHRRVHPHRPRGTGPRLDDLIAVRLRSSDLRAPRVNPLRSLPAAIALRARRVHRLRRVPLPRPAEHFRATRSCAVVVRPSCRRGERARVSCRGRPGSMSRDGVR